MPNNINQKLTIVGTKEDIEAFVITARGAAPFTGDKPGSANEHKRLRVISLSFHAIAPLPDSYSEREYSDHGYHLEANAWSVKWGPYECRDAVISEDGASATYEFQCAWGPPLEAMRRASMRYRCLRFFLSWGGEGPCRGRHSFNAGKTTEVHNDPYSAMEHEYPTGDEYEADEDAAAAKGDAAENKYILTHDEWVKSQA